MKVERFFHIRTQSATHGGATVCVNGDTDSVGHVGIQVAFCSKRDPFCKKTGRDVAMKAPTQVVPLRYLPARLSQVAAKVEKMTKIPAGVFDYSFATKYFLPKD